MHKHHKNAMDDASFVVLGSPWNSSPCKPLQALETFASHRKPLQALLQALAKSIVSTFQITMTLVLQNNGSYCNNFFRTCHLLLKFVQNLAATQMCQSQDFLLPLSQFFSQVFNNLNFWEFPNWIEFLSLERQFAVKLYFTYRRFVETARKGKTRSGSISRLSGYFCLPRALRFFFVFVDWKQQF